MAPFSFNPRAPAFVPGTHTLQSSLSGSAVPLSQSLASSTTSSLNPEAAVFVPASTLTTTSTPRTELPATPLPERQPRLMSSIRSSSVRRSYSGSRASSPQRSSSVPRYFAPPVINVVNTPQFASVDTEDQYKPPLIVDGAGPASRFGLDPTAPVFVPVLQPAQQAVFTPNPTALEYVPNNLLIARAQLSVILGQALPEEYVERFQTVELPMHRLASPVEVSGPETDFILVPKFQLNPEAKRFVPRLDPLAKEFVPANYNSCKIVMKRKNLNPKAKSFVPGQMWMNAEVDVPVMPALVVRWDIINEVFAQVVKRAEALQLTHTDATTCRALVKQSNKFVLVPRSSITSKFNPLAKEFVPAPKNTSTTLVHRMNARAPIFVSWVPFLVQALYCYRILVAATAYMMSLPNTCTNIIRRLNPLAKAFTPIKDMVVHYKDGGIGLILTGALLAIKIIASTSLVPLGPSPVIGPALRQRLFVPLLFMLLPSYEAMKFNGNHLAVQMQPLRSVGHNLPAIALAKDVPSLDTIFAGIQLDGASGSLQPLDVITLDSSTVANQELETTTGPLIVDSGSFVVEQAELAQD
ncbi:hypothetical protein OHC33_006816, partial [Knufia fluminis]